MLVLRSSLPRTKTRSRGRDGVQNMQDDAAGGSCFHVERRPRMRTALRRELHPRPQRDCASPQLLFSVTADAADAAAVRRRTRHFYTTKKSPRGRPADRVSAPPYTSIPAKRPVIRNRRRLRCKGMFFARRNGATDATFFFSLHVGFKVPPVAGDSTLAG